MAGRRIVGLIVLVAGLLLAAAFFNKAAAKADVADRWWRPTFTIDQRGSSCGPGFDNELSRCQQNREAWLRQRDSARNVALVGVVAALAGTALLLLPDKRSVPAEQSSARSFSGDQAPSPAVQEAPPSDTLERLVKLHESGALSSDEFEAAKRRYLGMDP